MQKNLLARYKKTISGKNVIVKHCSIKPTSTGNYFQSLEMICVKKLANDKQSINQSIKVCFIVA